MAGGGSSSSNIAKGEAQPPSPAPTSNTTRCLTYLGATWSLQRGVDGITLPAHNCLFIPQVQYCCTVQYSTAACKLCRLASHDQALSIPDQTMI